MYQPRRPVIITPDRNHHEHDYQGAFKPESDRLARYLKTLQPESGYPRILRTDISVGSGGRMTQIAQFIREVGSIDYLAFLMHGWHSSTQLINPAEPKYPDAVGALRLALRSASLSLASSSTCFAQDSLSATTASSASESRTLSSARPTIILYACSSDEVAKRLFQDLVDEFDLAVYAHTVLGHTTSNPFVRVFDRVHPEGSYLVDPASPYWGKWRKLLSQRGEDDSTNSDLRFKFPLLTSPEIEFELA
jgi:hypothetical protein